MTRSDLRGTMKATASSSSSGASSSVIPRWLLESNLTADLREEDVAALINDVDSGGGNAVSLRLYRNCIGGLSCITVARTG